MDAFSQIRLNNTMDIQIISIPKIEDFTGNVGVIEGSTAPFEIKRIFYLYDIQGDSKRGRHAHKELKQFIVAIYGSFEVMVTNGTDNEVVKLTAPDKGLLINPGLWSELYNFSPGAVCMVLASDTYDESDYIRNYEDYLNYVAVSK